MLGWRWRRGRRYNSKSYCWRRRCRGAYSRKVVSVTPGNSYTVTVGAGGVGGAGAGPAGGDSWFSTTGTIIAKGGAGGALANSGSTTEQVELGQQSVV